MGEIATESILVAGFKLIRSSQGELCPGTFLAHCLNHSLVNHLVIVNDSVLDNEDGHTGQRALGIGIYGGNLVVGICNEVIGIKLLLNPHLRSGACTADSGAELLVAPSQFA